MFTTTPLFILTYTVYCVQHRKQALGFITFNTGHSVHPRGQQTAKFSIQALRTNSQPAASRHVCTEHYHLKVTGDVRCILRHMKKKTRKVWSETHRQVPPTCQHLPAEVTRRRNPLTRFAIVGYWTQEIHVHAARMSQTWTRRKLTENYHTTWAFNSSTSPQIQLLWSRSNNHMRLYHTYSTTHIGKRLSERSGFWNDLKHWRGGEGGLIAYARLLCYK